MIDHLVYAVPDLDAAVIDLAQRLGETPTAGGRHIGRGTRNYLLSLGEGAYLEIISADPDQLEPEGDRPFGVDTLQEPHLVAWAAKAPEIEQRVAEARARGYDPGSVQVGSRETPDGTVLHWKSTAWEGDTAVNPVPFLIDWEGTAQHPSDTSAQGCRLIEFHAETPTPEEVARKLAALDISLSIAAAERPALIAHIEGPKGWVILR